MEASGTTPVEPVAPPAAPAAAAAAPTLDPATMAALAQSPEVQALIAGAVQQAVAAAGPVAPDGVAADPPKPPILSALKTLETELEGSTFAQRVEHLAHQGYQTIIDQEHERPALRTLLTIVEELVGKAVVA